MHGFGAILPYRYSGAPAFNKLDPTLGPNTTPEEIPTNE
jgi:hypothetical protein